jgi:hypothetical protein
MFGADLKFFGHDPLFISSFFGVWLARSEGRPEAPPGKITKKARPNRPKTTGGTPSRLLMLKKNPQEYKDHPSGVRKQKTDFFITTCLGLPK